MTSLTQAADHAESVAGYLWMAEALTGPAPEEAAANLTKAMDALADLAKELDCILIIKGKRTVFAHSWDQATTPTTVA